MMLAQVQYKIMAITAFHRQQQQQYSSQRAGGEVLAERGSIKKKNPAASWIAPLLKKLKIRRKCEGAEGEEEKEDS